MSSSPRRFNAQIRAPPMTIIAPRSSSCIGPKIGPGGARIIFANPSQIMIREWFANIALALGLLSLLGASPGMLRGQVLDPKGRPAAGAAVVARGQNVALSAVTDGNGRF